MIAPVMSLAQLRTKANTDPNYRKLAILAAENLGYKPNENLDEAMRQLRVEAQETSEDDVVEEVNFLRSDV
jgi:Holliday junction resolvasome RuvABC DNA-binding subunit